ncbi:MAG: phosphotransferase [Acholeplasma sp.]|nr:phosphotransferase [Acholeplasma sp.]
MIDIEKIIHEFNIKEVIPLKEGWSKDLKYILINNKKEKSLLRISDIKQCEVRQKQYNYLEKIAKLNLNCTKPIAFGHLDDNNIYTITSWLEGEKASEVIKLLSDSEAYQIGIDAGKILKRLHSIKVNCERSWWDDYQIKYPIKINNLKRANLKIPLQDKIISYYEENIHLMVDRPRLFSHGDYHLGNMLIHNKKIGIIDFDKANLADPYDEFKPFCWNVFESEYFATGLINGYFNNNIPSNFFTILKFYAIESLISFLPWSIQFG